MLLAKLSWLQTSALILLLFLLAAVPLIAAIRRGAARIKGVTSGLEKWRTIAAELGLEMPDPGQLGMRGVFQGINVQIAVRTVDTSTYMDGDKRSKDYFTYVVARITPPLGLSLAIAAPRSDLSKPAGSSLLDLGQQPQVAQTFAIAAGDTRRVEQLLLAESPSAGGGNVLQHLQRLSQEIPRIRINDQEVVLEQREIVEDPDALKHLLRQAVTLSAQFSGLLRA